MPGAGVPACGDSLPACAGVVGEVDDDVLGLCAVDGFPGDSAGLSGDEELAAVGPEQEGLRSYGVSPGLGGAVRSGGREVVGVSFDPDQGDVEIVDLDEDVAVFAGVMLLLRRIVAVVAGVGGGPTVECGSRGSDYVLVDVVVGVVVAVIDSCVVVEVVVAAEIGSTSCVLDCGPHCVPFGGMVVEAVGVQGAECRLVATDKDMRPGIGGQLCLKPGPVDFVHRGVSDSVVVVEDDNECVFVGDGIRHVLFARRSVGG